MMPYCKKCGQLIEDGAKFCPACGESVDSPQVSSDKRQQEWAGRIVKCPSCGAGISGFTANCPTCGHELRGVGVSHSVKEFSDRLGETDKDEQKIELIRSYPIPNTKEDIMEFMILAATNISGNIPKNLFEAWKVKFEQSYQKAKLLLIDATDLDKVQELYNLTNKKSTKVSLCKPQRAWVVAFQNL